MSRRAKAAACFACGHENQHRVPKASLSRLARCTRRGCDCQRVTK
jgi:hypothetical protein